MNDTQIDFLKVLAHTYMQHSKWDECLLILTLITRVDPQGAWAHLCLAFTNIQLKRGQMAIKEVELATPHAKGNERYLAELLRTKAMWDSGHKEQAQGLMMEYLSAMPEQPLLT
ncbi:MAG TPA: hypothetical protein PLV25_02580 [Opitutales bacterium]|nr:hypothetical protein [Opitutales bacterium]